MTILLKDHEAAESAGPRRPATVPGGFLAPFLDRAAREPDRVAFTLHQGGAAERLTHGGLLAGAARYGALFRARDLDPGAVVFIALKTSADLLEAFLGAALSGFTPALLPFPSAKQDPTLFWSSHEALFRHVGPSLVLTYPENADALARNVAPGLVAVAVPDDRPPSGPPLGSPEVRPDAAACLQHSSGTTGLKKGVPLTHAMIAAQAEAYAAALALSGQDRIVSWLPLYHDMGFVACFLVPLATGCPVSMLDPFAWLADPLALLDIAAAERATLTWLPNFAFRHLVNAAADERRRVDLSGMRAFVNCSEPCRPDTHRAFAARFAGWGVRPGQLAACYAMAEATFAVTQTRLGEPPPALALDREALDRDGQAWPATGDGAVESLSVGRPIAGTRISIRAPDGARLPEDRVGEIAVAGASVFAGYHRAPGRARFVEGEYLTGDLGFLRDGELHVLGRQDDLIIVLGRNVFAHEVEALAGSAPGVKPGRAAAFGISDPELGSEEVVVVAELADSDADRAPVRRAVRSRIESTLGIVPARIVLVEGGWLSKTTSGKVSRGQNREKYLSMARRPA